MARVIDEYAIAAIGEIERNVLVRLLARGAAVSVPDIDRLTVLHKRTEPLSETVDQFADSELELLVDEDQWGCRGGAVFPDLYDARVDDGVGTERHQPL